MSVIAIARTNSDQTQTSNLRYCSNQSRSRSCVIDVEEASASIINSDSGKETASRELSPERLSCQSISDSSSDECPVVIEPIDRETLSPERFKAVWDFSKNQLASKRPISSDQDSSDRVLF